MATNNDFAQLNRMLQVIKKDLNQYLNQVVKIGEEEFSGNDPLSVAFNKWKNSGDFDELLENVYNEIDNQIDLNDNVLRAMEIVN